MLIPGEFDPSLFEIDGSRALIFDLETALNPVILDEMPHYNLDDTAQIIDELHLNNFEFVENISNPRYIKGSQSTTNYVRQITKLFNKYPEGSVAIAPVVMVRGGKTQGDLLQTQTRNPFEIALYKKSSVEPIPRISRVANFLRRIIDFSHRT